MTHSIVYRTAEAADQPAIYACWLELTLNLPARYPLPFGMPVESEQAQQLTVALENCMQREDAQIYVAITEQGELAGTLSVILNQHAGYEKASSAVLFNLWVVERFRREGIATHLVSEARAWLADQQVVSVQAGWHPDNLAADRFWRGQGFSSYETIGAAPIASP